MDAPLLQPADVTDTAAALTEYFQKKRDGAKLREYRDALAEYMLAFDSQRRQIKLLMLIHAPLVLIIFLLAVVGGHNHVVNAVFLVYIWLFAAFVLAVAVFGLQTRRAWMPRFFGISMFTMSVASLVVIVYAVYTQVDMQMWYDILLVVLQVVDAFITLVYIWSADQMAGAGGYASAKVYEIDVSGLAVSPLASRTRTPGEMNRKLLDDTWRTRLNRWMQNLVAPRVRYTHSHGE